jgi:EmrB/QacA subfamily drug resistance transporter
MVRRPTAAVTAGGADPAAQLRMGTRAGRLAVAATVTGSAVAMVTGTVVNVALPDIADGLGAGTTGVQWILNAYLLTLASLILVGGALGDRYGRRRVYVLGTLLFGASSLAAAAAPTLPVLLAARAVMGVGGALLTPGSLAILEASFVAHDRSAAIGAWSGLGGVAAAGGPLLGGLLLDVAGWRVLFLINLPICAAAIALTLRHLPESSDPSARAARLDWAGTLTAAVGLAALTAGLIRLGEGVQPVALALLAAGTGTLVAFVVIQRRVAAPLVPLSLFADRTFAVANALTFVVYAALGGVFFLLVVFLRQVLGYSGLQAGAATLPMTVMLLLLSTRAGRLASRIGPRVPLTLGCGLLAAGMIAYGLLDAGSGYATAVLPGVLLSGAGLVLLVAPVTATVLAAADERRAGTASGINNAVARAAGLLAIAVLPPAAGLGPSGLDDPAAFAAGFPRAMAISAALTAAGALLAAVGLPSTLRLRRRDPHEAEVHEHPHAQVDCPLPARHVEPDPTPGPAS